MSKITAALVTALLGSSTAAMASPSVSFTASAQVNLGTSFSGPIVRDHRDAPMPAPVYEPAVYQPGYSAPANQWTSWISLGAPLSLADGRDVIRPSIANTSITQLRLQATTGMSYVQRVQVRFKDGSIQTLNLNQWLTTRNPLVDLSLQANRFGIDSITVLGSTQTRGASYQAFVQGSRSFEQPRPYPMPQPRPQPVMLADDLSFANTVGFRNFTVGAEKGPFSKIEISATHGTTLIKKVYIQFANGQEQTINDVDANLRAGQSVDITLDGHGANGIKQMVVWTNENYQTINYATGEFSVLGVR